MSLWDMYVFSVETARFFRHIIKYAAGGFSHGIIGRLLGGRRAAARSEDQLAEHRRAA